MPLRTLPALAAVCALVAGCGGADPAPVDGDARSAASFPSQSGSEPATDSTTDPDAATSWGPTEGELALAAELVARWDAEQLAGQVIVGRYDGTDPAVPARMVRDLHLAGVSVTSGNVTDAEQVRATTAAVTEAHAADGRDWPAVIGVDEEGGVVSHLRGIATEFPAFATAGVAIANRGRVGEQAVTEAARATGLELRDLGFTWVFAPVADVTIGAADPTIGTRSPSSDPALAARAITAAVTGYDEAGVVSTTKHFPGHGSVTADSHETLPMLSASLDDLRARDLKPFEAAVAAGAPSMMMAHLDVRALQPGLPSSQAPRVYDFLQDDLGFEGVTITDSLGMGAALSQDFPAVRALRAGADLLLMPVDTQITHQLVAEAITSGDVPRERVEEAAAKVVALQLWQQRTANEVPVPDDAAARAVRAAAALGSLGS
ncbi:MAG: glycoside hydrolase family 3 N-terminal domain-containing protein [Nocardioides sp.]